MNLHNAKLVLGIFILLSYISIGTFGLFEFNHMIETSMADCPYAQNSYSLCKNGLDHIENWRQFSNIILPSLITFLTLILILGMIPYLFDKYNSLNWQQYFDKWKYHPNRNKLRTYPNRIIGWLSLFENSPSYF